MRAFETLGVWSTSVPEPDVKGVLATHSRQHAWHAELWHDLLPTIGEAGVERFIEPPGPGLPAFVEALAAPDASDLTVEKLVGAYRVLVPHIVSAYGRHLDRTSPVSDGPTARALRLVLTDQLEHWREGEALIQAQLHGDTDVDRASSHQAALERLLIAAGGIAGPDS
jgi:hypothetical protein